MTVRDATPRPVLVAARARPDGAVFGQEFDDLIITDYTDFRTETPQGTGIIVVAAGDGMVPVAAHFLAQLSADPTVGEVAIEVPREPALREEVIGLVEAVEGLTVDGTPLAGRACLVMTSGGAAGEPVRAVVDRVERAAAELPTIEPPRERTVVPHSSTPGPDTDTQAPPREPGADAAPTPPTEKSPARSLVRLLRRRARPHGRLLQVAAGLTAAVLLAVTCALGLVAGGWAAGLLGLLVGVIALLQVGCLYGLVVVRRLLLRIVRDQEQLLAGSQRIGGRTKRQLDALQRVEVGIDHIYEQQHRSVLETVEAVSSRLRPDPAAGPDNPH